MVSYVAQPAPQQPAAAAVLILIVMEDGLVLPSGEAPILVGVGLS